MSSRSDHIKLFPPVSSLQVPYNVLQHGLHAGGSSQVFPCSLVSRACLYVLLHCFLSLTSLLITIRSFSAAFLVDQLDCVSDLVISATTRQSALERFPFSCQQLDSCLFLAVGFGAQSIWLRPLGHYRSLPDELLSACFRQVPRFWFPQYSSLLDSCQLSAA